MVSLNSMMNRVAEKHFLKVTKRRKLTDSRTHSPSETFTTLDLSPGTYDRFRVGRAFVSAAFAFSPSYQQPAGVVPPLSRKLTARSCSAASLGDVPLTGQPSSESSATKSMGAFGWNP